MHYNKHHVFFICFVVHLRVLYSFIKQDIKKVDFEFFSLKSATLTLNTYNPYIT